MTARQNPRWSFGRPNPAEVDAFLEEGEERFSVELQANGTVWYDLRAFSRPRYWPVRMGAPLARRLQRRFVRESQATMVRLVRAAEGKP